MHVNLVYGNQNNKLHHQQNYLVQDFYRNVEGSAFTKYYTINLTTLLLPIIYFILQGLVNTFSLKSTPNSNLWVYKTVLFNVLTTFYNVYCCKSTVLTKNYELFVMQAYVFTESTFRPLA